MIRSSAFWPGQPDPLALSMRFTDLFIPLVRSMYLLPSCAPRHTQAVNVCARRVSYSQSALQRDSRGGEPVVITSSEQAASESQQQHTCGRRFGVPVLRQVSSSVSSVFCKDAKIWLPDKTCLSQRCDLREKRPTKEKFANYSIL